MVGLVALSAIAGVSHGNECTVDMTAILDSTAQAGGCHNEIRPDAGLLDATFVMTARSQVNSSQPTNPDASGSSGNVWIDGNGTGVKTSRCGGSRGISGGGGDQNEELIFTFDNPVSADSVVLYLNKIDFSKDTPVIFISSSSESGFDYTILEAEIQGAFTSTETERGKVSFSGFASLPPGLDIDKFKIREVDDHIFVNKLQYEDFLPGDVCDDGIACTIDSCDEQNDVCVHDIEPCKWPDVDPEPDGDGFVGPGDLALLAECWLLCPEDEDYATGLLGGSCDRVNFVNCSPDDCVGPEDFSFFVTAWRKDILNPTIVMPPVCASNAASASEWLPLPTVATLRAFGLAVPPKDWKGYQRGKLFELVQQSVVKASDDTELSGSTPRVTVTLLLLDSPSSPQTTNDLALLGSPISDPAQLSVGGKAYLEAWCQTPGPNGISSAVVDITYDTESFDTFPAQVYLASQWNTLSFDVSVDDQVGRIDDFGGNNLSVVLGVAPSWVKIGTVEFDVVTAPTGPVSFCSEFAGGFLTFAVRGEGSVQPTDVQYGCFALGCQQNADCEEGFVCDLDNDQCVCPNLATPEHFAAFIACLDGPDEDVLQKCVCADFDDDGDVDLRDFSELQRQSVAP